MKEHISANKACLIILGGNASHMQVALVWVLIRRLLSFYSRSSVVTWCYHKRFDDRCHKAISTWNSVASFALWRLQTVQFLACVHERYFDSVTNRTLRSNPQVPQNPIPMLTSVENISTAKFTNVHPSFCHM